ncbi:MAG: hypothetical protein IJX17_06575 [Clostridia bacterium]|nr:hypothetical protein [Clostridia bacterium]
MELIDAKCPNCGSAISIKPGEKSGVCEHCGSKFILDEEVNITNNYIIKNDFGDDVLFNEVDKYLGHLSLSQIEELNKDAENLKSKFPHKGIARICILHNEFVNLIIKYGTEDDFENEAIKAAEVNEKYKPKSYKQTPKFSKYLENDIVEMSYAEDLDDMLTDEEKTKYPKLINKTKEYLETYTAILDNNKEMLQKFEPYQAKYDKVAAKNEKKATPEGKAKRRKISLLITGISCLLIVALVAIVFLSNFVLFKKPYVNVTNADNLSAPTKVTTNVSAEKEILGKSHASIYFLTEYTINGRVLGSTHFLPTTAENVLAPICIGLAWGKLSTPEDDNDINWKCSLFSKNISYTYKESSLSASYINSHISANLVIPADKKVAKALRSIRKDDLVEIKGYLAMYSIETNQGKLYSRSSSTSLYDGEAEIIYVTSVNWIQAEEPTEQPA